MEAHPPPADTGGPQEEKSHFEGVVAPANAPPGRSLAIVFVSRLLINIQMRFIYPYLPAVGRGLGIPLETASLMVTARALAGLSSPLFGMLSDRFGRKLTMLLGLLALVTGSGLALLTRNFILILLAFILLGLSRASYDPAAQAYVSDQAPYGQRGRMLGLLELSWPLSWLIGVPLAGLLISWQGWQLPFACFALVGLVCLGLTSLLQAHTQMYRPRAHNTQKQLQQRNTPIHLSWSMMAALAASTLLASAYMNLFMVYGVWMETQFGLSVGVLGFVSVIVSLAEFTAAGATAGLLDQLGKLRALCIGILVNIPIYLWLPSLSSSLLTALLGAALLFFISEFCLVAILPVLSEIDPANRGTVMSINAALISVGVMGMSIVAPRLWQVGGLRLNMTISAALAFIAWLSVVVIRRGQDEK
jgi:predicted MFS family arabinose efflux permease